MIDFSKYDEQSCYREDDKAEYNRIVKDITFCVQKSTLDKYELGRKLIEFFESKRYGFEKKRNAKFISILKVLD